MTTNKYLQDPEFLAAVKQASLCAPVSGTNSSQAVETRPSASRSGKRAHIMLSTPTLGGFKVPYMFSLMGMITECQRRNTGFSLSLMDGCSLIGAARNGLVKKLLDNQHATHMLMVDDDIGWSPADVFRMLDSGHDFVVGAVPMRQINYAELEYFLKQGGKIEDAKKHVARFNINASNTDHIVSMTDDGLVEIAYAGTAFMLVSRKAIEKLIAESGAEYYEEDGQGVYDLFGCIVENKQLNGEDISFCKRWTRIGGKIFCLTDASFTHCGNVNVEGKFSDVLESA